MAALLVWLTAVRYSGLPFCLCHAGFSVGSRTLPMAEVPEMGISHRVRLEVPPSLPTESRSHFYCRLSRLWGRLTSIPCLPCLHRTPWNFHRRSSKDTLQDFVIVNIWKVLDIFIACTHCKCIGIQLSPQETAHWSCEYFFFFAKANPIIIITVTVIYFVEWCIYFVNVSWCCWLCLCFVT